MVQEGERTEFEMRRPCQGCRSSEGYIVTRSGQDCVFCAACDTFQYNAPRTETGRAVRSVSTVHEAIRTNQRARIIERASGRCELCGAPPPLDIGHLLSVKDGLAEGLTESIINSDENLAAMCKECNLGFGPRSVPVRLMVALLRRRAS